jgi:hypothetical protein
MRKQKEKIKKRSDAKITRHNSMSKIQIVGALFASPGVTSEVPSVVPG